MWPDWPVCPGARWPDGQLARWPCGQVARRPVGQTDQVAGLARCLRLCLQEYSNWETDEVITKELVRNLGIALACVFLTTLLLLANFLGSLMVLLCVAIVLVYIILHCTALPYIVLQ